MRRFSRSSALLLLLAATGVAQARALNLLFLGNSYTQFNSLPSKVADLAQAGGFSRPNVSAYTPGGYLLLNHAADPAVQLLIRNGFDGEPWDVVVLQEQSQLPATSEVEDFYTGATSLYDRIKADNPEARVFLFETWARHAEWDFSQEPFIGKDPEDMQERLRLAYRTAATTWIPDHSTVERRTDVAVSPVGDAWERSYVDDPGFRLHQADNSHPNPAGTYLAALVIYSTIYRRSAVGLPDLGMVPADVAARFQRLADQTTGKPLSAPNIGVVLGVLGYHFIRQRTSRITE